MEVYLTGTFSAPVVEFVFPFDAVHAVTGEPLREWIKNLPAAAWNESTRRWTVRDFGARDVAWLLAHAGFPPAIGFDGEPADLSQFTGAIAVAETVDGHMTAAVHPRLGGQALIRSRIPATAMWRKSDCAWVTMPYAVATVDGPVGWCAVDDRLVAWVAANPEQTFAMLPQLPSGDSLAGLMSTPVSDVMCVTPQTADAMRKVGTETVFDLVTTIPRRYIDLSRRTIVAATVGEQTSVTGVVASLTTPSFAERQAGRTMTRARIVDDNGAAVFVRWFRTRGLASRIPEGSRVVIAGKLETFVGRNGRPGFSMTNPIVEPVVATTATMIGVYPASELNDVSTWTVAGAAREAVHRITGLADPVPAWCTSERGMPSRADAFRMIHDPASAAEATAGRKRIAYDELLRLQLVVRAARADTRAQPGIVHEATGSITGAFLSRLPYRLTGAQQRVAVEISDDMAAARPMSRLVQGDVGSGKTANSILAMLTAVESGHQAAMMVPNEILAVQHFDDVTASVEGLVRPDGKPVSVALATGKVTGKDRKTMLAGLADGSVDIVVGTHALIEPKVVFASLSLVVIDEQHRFGVEQRSALRGKGAGGVLPDMLYTTATPVPRTVAMTAFGDLDQSTIDEMPPGRSPVTTVHIPGGEDIIDEAAADPWSAIRNAVSQGRQAFVVTPLATSVTREASGAHDVAARLGAGPLAGLRIGVVTGKDTSQDRHAAMSAFAAGGLDVLVATTVVEVGVNVPNATVMVVLGGERFGLAQLHQLRGRVGRGVHPGRCLIVAQPKTVIAKERMAAITTVTDGFALADLDYRLRGGGDLAGASQSGRAKSLRVASLTGDADMLALAIMDAARIIDADPTLAEHSDLRDEITLLIDETSTGLLRSA